MYIGACHPDAIERALSLDWPCSTEHLAARPLRTVQRTWSTVSAQESGRPGLWRPSCSSTGDKKDAHSIRGENRRLRAAHPHASCTLQKIPGEIQQTHRIYLAQAIASLVAQFSVALGAANHLRAVKVWMLYIVPPTVYTRSTNIASGSRNSFLPLVMPTWKLLAQVLDDMIDVDHQNGTGDFIHPARPACRSFDVCERRVFCQPSEGNVPQNILRVRACRSYDGPNQSHYLRHSVNNSCMMR